MEAMNFVSTFFYCKKFYIFFGIRMTIFVCYLCWRFKASQAAILFYPNAIKRFKRKEHLKPPFKKGSLSTLKRANELVGFCACGRTKGDKYEVMTILNTTVINNRVEHQLVTGNSSETSEERWLCCNTVRIALITNN